MTSPLPSSSLSSSSSSSLSTSSDPSSSISSDWVSLPSPFPSPSPMSDPSLSSLPSPPSFPPSVDNGNPHENEIPSAPNTSPPTFPQMIEEELLSPSTTLIDSPITLSSVDASVIPPSHSSSPDEKSPPPSSSSSFSSSSIDLTGESSMALDVARDFFDRGEFSSAERVTRRSLQMRESEEGRELLRRIMQASTAASSSPLSFITSSFDMIRSHLPPMVILPQYRARIMAVWFFVLMILLQKITSYSYNNYNYHGSGYNNNNNRNGDSHRHSDHSDYKYDPYTGRKYSSSSTPPPFSPPSSSRFFFSFGPFPFFLTNFLPYGDVIGVLMMIGMMWWSARNANGNVQWGQRRRM